MFIAIGILSTLLIHLIFYKVYSANKMSDEEKEEFERKQLAFALAVEAMQTNNKELLNTVMTCYSEYLSDTVVSKLESFILDQNINKRVAEDFSDFEDRLEQQNSNLNAVKK